jgi:hypothetical protein
MKNGVFCDVTLCGAECRLLVKVNVPSSPILVTLMMEALSSSETSVLTRATRQNIPEDGILHVFLISLSNLGLRKLMTVQWAGTTLHISCCLKLGGGKALLDRMGHTWHFNGTFMSCQS